jgi:hypothetical protein
MRKAATYYRLHGQYYVLHVTYFKYYVFHMTCLMLSYMLHNTDYLLWISYYILHITWAWLEWSTVGCGSSRDTDTYETWMYVITHIHAIHTHRWGRVEHGYYIQRVRVEESGGVVLALFESLVTLHPVLFTIDSKQCAGSIGLFQNLLSKLTYNETYPASHCESEKDERWGRDCTRPQTSPRLLATRHSNRTHMRHDCSYIDTCDSWHCFYDTRSIPD